MTFSNRLIKTLSLALLFSMALSTPLLAKDKKEDAKLPEVTKDGLHLQPNTEAYAVYALPGASLAQYDEVWLIDCYVQFVKDWQRNYNLEEISLEGQVSNREMEEIKSKVAAEFKKVFTKVLTDNGDKVVSAAGKNVLVVRPAIINLDPTAPDTQIGWQTTVVRSAGSMTLYMELYDSTTNTLLARIIDPQYDREAIAQRANTVTNTAAADRILTMWAKRLAEHLGSTQKATG